MASALQFTFKTFIDDDTTGFRTYYKYTADYDAQGALTSLVVYDLEDSVISPSQAIIDLLEADSLIVYNAGAPNAVDAVIQSDLDYPSGGNINEIPTSHSGGVGT